MQAKLAVDHGLSQAGKRCHVVNSYGAV